METLNNIHVALAVIFCVVVVLVLACFVYFDNFEKEDPKTGETSGGGFWKFVLSIIIVIVVLSLFGMCGDDGTPWSPRHTQIVKPTQNNVNSSIFVLGGFSIS